jgi:hypothetical protein
MPACSLSRSLSVLPLAIASVLPLPAMAQGKLDARYVATVGGLPVGKGTWLLEIADDRYSGAVTGVTLGLLSVFATGEGSGAVRGAVANGKFMPGNYAVTISNSKRSEDVRFAFSGNTVKDVVIEPPPNPDPMRIPITDAHRKGVVDPMTSALVRVPGTGEVVGPGACSRTTSVFDGRLRYDLTTTFKRMETVTTEKGYRGPVAVCGIIFKPIAGYVPERAAIKYIAQQRDMEIALAPISGTRVLVPYRIRIPTPIGPAALEATQFLTEAGPHLTPTSARVR